MNDAPLSSWTITGEFTGLDLPNFDIQILMAGNLQQHWGNQLAFDTTITMAATGTSKSVALIISDPTLILTAANAITAAANNLTLCDSQNQTLY